MRVVLDSNVLVSGLIRPDSPCGQILRWVQETRIELAASPAMVAEFRRATRYPRVRKYILLTDSELEARLTVFEVLADLVGEVPVVAPRLRDPDDLKVLATAVSGRAEFIVTGDLDLLALGQHDGIGIVTPRAFHRMIEP